MNVSELATIPSGRSFLSYKRERLAEARALVRALQLLGVPTFQDIDDLEHGPTEDTLRQVLASPETAGGVALLTPEIVKSAIIHSTEIPLLLQRFRAKDGFFFLGVVGGGLDYGDVPGLFPSGIGAEDLSRWNLHKVHTDPLTFADAQLIASQVLTHRLQAITRASGDRLRISLNTRDRPAFDPSYALRLDWSPEFDARAVTPEWWTSALLPALQVLSKTAIPLARDRGVALSGFLSLPAAVALGAAFVETAGVPVDWHQAGQPPDAPWSLAASDEPVDVDVQFRAADAAAADLAVLISITDGVERPFGAVLRDLPSLRATIHVTARSLPLSITSPGQAAGLVRMVRDAVRRARRDYGATGAVHLFMAVPVGVAVLLGQLLNTLGAVHTYDFHAGEPSPYTAAVQIEPSI